MRSASSRIVISSVFPMLKTWPIARGSWTSLITPSTTSPTKVNERLCLPVP
jgi:hypothetical protein